MTKLFTSRLTEILNDLGCDGYFIDKDLIMQSLNTIDPTKDAKERDQIVKQYYYCSGKIGKRIYHKGGLFPRRGFLEILFDYVHKANQCTTVYEGSWDCRWVDAHVNLILNRIYGTNKPEIDSFILLNSGALDQLIIKVFGGKETRDDEANFTVALAVAQSNLGEQLTCAEKELIRSTYFKRTDDELMQIKNALVNEIMQEWDAFSKISMDDLLNKEVN